MANFWDGSQYVGLDDEAFGDGETDLTTLPLDTYIENVIDGNHKYLTKNKDHVTVSPAINFQETSKRFCSYRRYAPKDLIKIPAYEDATIKLTVNGEIFTDTVATGTGELSIRLVYKNSDGLAQLGDRSTLEVDENDGQFHTVQLDMASALESFSDVSLDALENVWVEFSFVNITEPEAIGESWGIVSTLGNGTIDLDTRRPIESNYLLKSSNVNGDRYSHPLTQDEDANLQVWPRYNTYEDDVYETSYWQIFSWEWEIEVNQEKEQRGYSPKQSDSMLPNDPVRGRDTYIHASNYDAIATQTKMTAVPRPGERAPTSSLLYWPSAERPEFGYLSGRSEYEVNDRVDRFLIKPKSNLCDLEVNFWSGHWFVGTRADEARDLLEAGRDATIPVRDYFAPITYFPTFYYDFILYGYKGSYLEIDRVRVVYEFDRPNYHIAACLGTEDPFLQRQAFSQWSYEASLVDTYDDPLYSYQDGTIRNDSYPLLTNVSALFKDVEASQYESLMVEIYRDPDWDENVELEFEQRVIQSFFPSVLEKPKYE